MKAKFVLNFTLFHGGDMKGVYKITNIINNKVYIGKTSVCFKERLEAHLYSLKRGDHCNKHLQRAWNKYGGDSFTYDILFVSENEKEINDKEIEFIDKYKSTVQDFGYNLTSGGESGYRLSEETKQKMSLSARGKGTNLTERDVRHIKLSMYCLMDRNEISKMFKVSTKALVPIAQGKNFNYVSSELNDAIFNIRNRMIEERNQKLLELFDSGMGIGEIVRATDYSFSIVEKCIYKYRDVANIKRKERQKIYDEVQLLMEQGYLPYQISKMLGVPSTTVSRYSKKENSPYKELPFKKITKDISNFIITSYFKDNMTIKDIVKEINKTISISDTTVRDVVNRYKYANTETTILGNTV